MVKRQKLLFVYHLLDFLPSIPSFVQKDIELLKNNFDIKVVPFKFKKIFTLPSDIYNSEVIFIWWAGIHAFITTFFAKIIGKPTIVVTGGYDVACEKKIKYGMLQYSFLRWMVKFVLLQAKKILAVSEFNQGEIEKYFGIQESEVVYPCVDINYFVPKGNKEKFVISVGLITDINIKRKGLEVFVRAAKELSDITFFIVGSEEKKASQYLKSIAPSNVVFTGFISREELLKLYQKAKVCCQLSYYESFGLAPAEAMSCECVPVVTERGALPEVVGDTGFYTDYGDIKGTVNAITINNEFPSKPNSLLRTIYVDDDNTDGPWRGTLFFPYQYIRDGVNAANNGDTVFVYNGYYDEKDLIRVEKRIKIIGENRDDTIVHRSDRIIWIVATDYVTIRDLTIDASGASEGEEAIKITGNFCKITNCRIINSNFAGITTWSFTTVSNNIITNNGYGLYNSADGFSIIKNNHFENNNHYGVYLKSIYGNFNIIKGNNFINNGKNAGFEDAEYNFWNSNYWDDWTGLIPYVIQGRVYIGDIDFYTNHGWEDRKNYDWNPVEKPYNITNIDEINSYVRIQNSYNPINILLLQFLERFPLLNLLLQRLRI